MKIKVFNRIKQFFLRIVGKRFLINQFSFWFVMCHLTALMWVLSSVFYWNQIQSLENQNHSLIYQIQKQKQSVEEPYKLQINQNK